MSKLMEKAIAKCIQHDLVAHELVTSTQFGGRMHSSCLDAVLTLIHDIQAAHAVGLKAGMVLFNIKGFFNNINHDWMIAVLVHMGFNLATTNWMREFLHERKVHLKFNCITLEERIQPVRVPQGSPLSLVLLIIYMSGLLHQMRHWNNSSLGMYVDNGALFTCTEEWADVEKLLRASTRSVRNGYIVQASLWSLTRQSSISSRSLVLHTQCQLLCISCCWTPWGAHTTWCCPQMIFVTWASSYREGSSGIGT